MGILSGWGEDMTKGNNMRISSPELRVARIKSHNETWRCPECGFRGTQTYVPMQRYILHDGKHKTIYVYSPIRGIRFCKRCQIVFDDEDAYNNPPEDVQTGHGMDFKTLKEVDENERSR